MRVVGRGAFGKVRIVERKDTNLSFALKYIRKDDGTLLNSSWNLPVTCGPSQRHANHACLQLSDPRASAISYGSAECSSKSTIPSSVTCVTASRTSSTCTHTRPPCYHEAPADHLASQVSRGRPHERRRFAFPHIEKDLHRRHGSVLDRGAGLRSKIHPQPEHHPPRCEA